METLTKLRPRPNWGFVCGRITVLEGRLVGKEFFLTLLGLERVEDLVPHLQDTLLRDYLGPGSAWEDFSALADRFFQDMVVSLREDSPAPLPAGLFVLQGDYLNLKNALLGLTEFPFFPATISSETLTAIAGGDFADLPASLREAGVGVPGGPAEMDPAILDILLDGAFLRHLLALSREVDAPLVRACIQERVQARAVGVLWRALRQNRPLRLYAQHFLPVGDFTPALTELLAVPDVRAWPPLVGGKVGELLAEAVEAAEDEQIPQFERLVDDYVTALAREGRTQTAGPERVFAFVAALQAETQNLKLAIFGRLNHIAPDLLRQRLRE